jgi:carbon monoxide dehydrogenase subunit G
VTAVQRGVLLLADISGYTKFVTSVELEHSTDILADLLGAVVEQTSGVLKLSKLEGDAVFCYAERELGRQELLTLMEAVYFAFRRRQRDISHLTTCTCAACRALPELDLKLIVHHGDFAFHDVAGHHELVGREVITVHRLLKNDATALHGYALLTDAVVQALEVDTVQLEADLQCCEVDGIGPTSSAVIDLNRWWDRHQQQHQVQLGADDLLVASAEMPAPPPVVWEWLADPARRQRWNGADSITEEDPGGMPGVGSVSHCVHGKMKIREEILDWQPYGYATLRSINPIGAFLFTLELTELADGAGSRVDVYVRRDAGGVKRAMWPLLSRKVKSSFVDGLAIMRRLIEEEQATMAAPRASAIPVATSAT